MPNGTGIPQPATVEEVKPGYKTTEFWLTSVASLLGLLFASGIIAPEGTDGLSKAFALIATALTAMGYSVSRGLAKKGS